MKNYTPYQVAEEQPHRLTLQAKKSYAVWWFTGFRIVPVFIFLFLGIAAPGLYKDLPRAVFVGMYLFFIGSMLFLWFQTYITEITLEKSSITHKIKTFFAHRYETETLHEADHILVVREHRGKSSHWSFYHVKDNNKKKRLFHIPIFFYDNRKSRNNFVEAFEQICQVKTVVND